MIHMRMQLFSLNVKKEVADASLRKLVNRKKALYSTRMKEFLELYGRIHEIEFRPGQGIQELFKSPAFTTESAQELRIMAATSMKPLSDKEMVVKFLFGGLGNCAIAESKRAVQIANTQVEKLPKPCMRKPKLCPSWLKQSGKGQISFQPLLSELSKRFGVYLQAATQIIDRNGTNEKIIPTKKWLFLLTA